MGRGRCGGFLGGGRRVRRGAWVVVGGGGGGLARVTLFKHLEDCAGFK